MILTPEFLAQLHMLNMLDRIEWYLIIIMLNVAWGTRFLPRKKE